MGLLFCGVVVINVNALAEASAFVATAALATGLVDIALLSVLTVYSVWSGNEQDILTYAGLLITAFMGTCEAYGVYAEVTVTGDKGSKTVTTDEIRKYAKSNLTGSVIKQENPLEDIVYTDKVKRQMWLGDYHSFPKSVDAFGSDGKVKPVVGGDDVSRTLIEISGTYRNKEGVFQYIIESDGVTCNHRLFIPN